MDRILIVDFGSQYTQLIAKQVRKCCTYCEVVPYHKIEEYYSNLSSITVIKGIILSGSPHSVLLDDSPYFDFSVFDTTTMPILGICYGAQYIAEKYGATISPINKKISQTGREFGEQRIYIEENLLFDISGSLQVWMSHNDTILPHDSFMTLAKTENDILAAFQIKDTQIYGVQFHPEVSHTEKGIDILQGFLNLCSIDEKYTMSNYLKYIEQKIKDQIGAEKVIVAVSGGVDSTVTACLLHRILGKQLICVFVNNGLLRKNEIEEVERIFKEIGLDGVTVDASDIFYDKLKYVSDPEQKRKIIGSGFIEVFEKYIKLQHFSQEEEIKWLGQGTIYPDIIESVPGFGLIKSHHNVGGLPEKMQLKLVEPLRDLFKDEVRELGEELGIPKEFIYRHPFPGPGLAIRIIGDITPDKVAILQEADDIFIQEIKKAGLYGEIWQAGVILLSTKTVGVMGDRRTYEYVVALRAVCSVNGMTAKPYMFDMSFLEKIGTKIINEVPGINRVVYDISSKPPATIEWE